MTLGITQQEVAERLYNNVYQHFANNVNSRNLGNDYNFLECQQAQSFLSAIADAFGWTNPQINQALNFEYYLSNMNAQESLDTDFEIDTETGEVFEVPKTCGWVDCAILNIESSVLWELKSPTNLNGSPRPLTPSNLQQLWRYWHHMSAPRPRYLILSNFREFRIYDTNNPQSAGPISQFPLEEIHQNLSAFPFFGSNPNQAIAQQQQEISITAARQLVGVFNGIVERGIDQEVALRFITRCGLMMYLEDIEYQGSYLLPREAGVSFGRFHNSLIQISNNEQIFAETHLFPLMQSLGQEGGSGIYADLPLVSEEWFQFDGSDMFDLLEDELQLLIQCAEHDWSRLDPVIFGNIVESCFTDAERLEGGIFYTHPDDIDLIIGPLITEPWERRIQNILGMNVAGGANSPSRRRRMRALTDAISELRELTVLDPACGSGNFLFIAYREIKRIEAVMFDLYQEWIGDVHQATLSGDVTSQQWEFIYPDNMIGYELQPRAAQIGRLVLALAGMESAINYDNGENPLPLHNTARICCMDSLIDDSGDEVQIREWDDAALIVGNPPFMGARGGRLRNNLGDVYTNDLFRLYSDSLANSSDLSMYFVRKAQEMIRDNRSQCFGMITTSSCTAPESRGVLDTGIEENLVISLAYKIRDWPVAGANQPISIICMERESDNHLIQPTRLAIDRDGDLSTVGQIYSTLTNYDMTEMLQPLAVNIGRCFQGYKGMDKEFRIIDTETANQLLSANNIEEGLSNSDVVIQLADGQYFRDRTYKWIIDFRDFDEMTASEYIAPFQHMVDLGLEQHILDKNTNSEGQESSYAKYNHQDRWWQILWNRRSDMWTTIHGLGLQNYIIKQEVAARSFHFEMISTSVAPDGALYVILSERRWELGVLLSDIHEVWFNEISANRGNSGRYQTPVFESFPIPSEPSNEQINLIEAAVSAYFERIDSLLPLEQYNGRLDLLMRDPPHILVLARQQINRAVYPLYGLDADGNHDQAALLAAASELKHQMLLIEEETCLQESQSQLTSIPGLGDTAIVTLNEAGILNYSQLIQAGVSGLTQLDGIGPSGAANFVAFARGVQLRIEEINQLLNSKEEE